MSEQNPHSIPEGETTSAFSEWGTSDGSEGENDLSHLPPAHRDVFRRLRRKVRQAAAYIERLEEDNEQLRARVSELKNRPAISPEKTALALEAEPEELREQISQFIDAIDAYLEDDPTDSADVESAPESTA